MIRKNSEYDQEIPQTADNRGHRKEEPLNHNETPGRQMLIIPGVRVLESIFKSVTILLKLNIVDLIGLLY